MNKITDLRIGMECRARCVRITDVEGMPVKVRATSTIKITGISTKTYGVNASGAYEEVVIVFDDGRELSYKEACELFNNQPEF